MKSKRILGLVIFILSLYIFVLFEDEYRYNDGIDGTLKKMLFFSRDTTLYAENYSDSLFFRLKPYSSEELTLSFIGKPLYKMKSDGVDRWFYSKSGGGDYRVREMRFHKGRLVGKVHYYYFD